MEFPNVCVERILTEDLNEIARARAIEENPANALPFEAAADWKKLWRPGRRLNITFLDGDSEVQRKVIEYALIWTQYANIHFDFGATSGAEIRISFKKKGSWSAIGTDALVEEYFRKDEPTMNFGWLKRRTPEREYSRVVLHEFGHALGMIHEHQSPQSKIQWNKPAVIEYYSGDPNYWSEQQIQFNIFDKYLITETNFTTFDSKSIMLYFFPQEWTMNGIEFSENCQLSDTDKQFIQECYPAVTSI